jgi:adenylate cyclase
MGTSIEWCEKALANNVKERGIALAYLAVANAWAGHDKEAKDAVAELRKVDPAFTVQTWAGFRPSDDPTFKAQFVRILEGLRKAGVPEGEKKTN